jgi:hypothetical protein
MVVSGHFHWNIHFIFLVESTDATTDSVMAITSPSSLLGRWPN